MKKGFLSSQGEKEEREGDRQTPRRVARSEVEREEEKKKKKEGFLRHCGTLEGEPQHPRHECDSPSFEKGGRPFIRGERSYSGKEKKKNLHIFSSADLRRQEGGKKEPWSRFHVTPANGGGKGERGCLTPSC